MRVWGVWGYLDMMVMQIQLVVAVVVVVVVVAVVVVAVVVVVIVACCVSKTKRVLTFFNLFCQDGFTSRIISFSTFDLRFPLFVYEESSLRPMSCDIVVAGGGISGMYMAETLMRMKKENNVCLFEKDSRFGGRDYDYRFSQAPNISISKLVS